MALLFALSWTFGLRATIDWTLSLGPTISAIIGITPVVQANWVPSCELDAGAAHDWIINLTLHL
jgi:hypothetical protein